ncbi:MAG: hypothetical protein AAGA54_04650 [Myxococcota bacterium]
MLAQLTLAMTMATCLHALVEPTNLGKRVGFIGDALRGETVEEGANPLDSKPKIFAFILVFLAVLAGITFGIAWALDLSVRVCLLASIGVSAVVEVANTLRIDSVHSVISQVLDAARRSRER